MGRRSFDKLMFRNTLVGQRRPNNCLPTLRLWDCRILNPWSLFSCCKILKTLQNSNVFTVRCCCSHNISSGWVFALAKSLPRLHLREAEANKFGERWPKRVDNSRNKSGCFSGNQRTGVPIYIYFVHVYCLYIFLICICFFPEKVVSFFCWVTLKFFLWTCWQL